MLIGIDGNEANVEWKVGISEYAFELLWQFYKLRTKNLELRIYLKDKPRTELPEGRDGWTYRVIGPRKLWTQIGLPLDLYRHKPQPDVFFTPTHYAPRFSPIPTVVSVMDLSYIHFPELFKKSDLYQLRNWTAYSIQKAHKVFTISNASRNDIIDVYGVPADSVVVTYPGIKMSSKFKIQNSKLFREKYGIEGDYILFVGTLQPRKNIVRLIEAFSFLCHPELVSGSRTSDKEMPKRVRHDMQLVIVGKKGWLYEDILAAPAKFGVEEKVKFLDFVSDEDLAVLYQNAVCFVLPSLYEGFGLPILEAMQYGCPVITSNVSSLSEAGGDAALYVDPKDVDEIAAAMEKLLTNEKLRKDLIAKGYKQVKKFSWEKTARETLAVLEEVAKK